MTLKTGTHFNDIPVCPKCGWTMVGPYEVERHRDCSLIGAGTLAVQLARRFPELMSTKFGYGSRQLAFELDKGLRVRFQCEPDRFHLQDVWLLNDLSIDEAAGLVAAVASWRAACLAARLTAASSTVCKE